MNPPVCLKAALRCCGLFLGFFCVFFLLLWFGFYCFGGGGFVLFLLVSILDYSKKTFHFQCN